MRHRNPPERPGLRTQAQIDADRNAQDEADIEFLSTIGGQLGVCLWLVFNTSAMPFTGTREEFEQRVRTEWGVLGRMLGEFARETR